MPHGPDSSATNPPMPVSARMPVRLETVARQFDRRWGVPTARDVLPREVDRRLQSRLSYIRLEPRHVLDVGCGLGGSRERLLEIYPGSHWTGIDLSVTRARAGLSSYRRQLGLARWWRRESNWIVADAACLPIADGSVDLLYSNLMLHWHPAPHQVFPEWRRVLSVEGLLMFSCFGPDTLRELRAAVADALPHARPVPFVDMHDFGDMLLASGFASPVMDVETITLTFAAPRDLLAEVRALGGNPHADRATSLPSGRQARRLLAALAERRTPDGRIPLTFEVAYGHAWKPAPQSTGVGTVSVDALRSQLRQRNARPQRASKVWPDG